MAAPIKSTDYTIPVLGSKYEWLGLQRHAGLLTPNPLASLLLDHGYKTEYGLVARTEPVLELHHVRHILVAVMSFDVSVPMKDASKESRGVKYGAQPVLVILSKLQTERYNSPCRRR